MSTLLWECGKFFLMFTAGLYAVVALILLIYLPFCIADCLRQRRSVGRWSPAAPSVDRGAPAVEAPSTLQPIV
jgi:hypothetical protein